MFMIIKRVAVLFLSVAFVLNSMPGFAAPIASQRRAVPEAGKCSNCPVSEAVVSAATSDLVNVLTRAKRNELRASDLQSAITSHMILIAHFEEIGAFDRMDQQIVANRSKIINFVASEEDITRIQAMWAHDGVPASPEQIRSALQLNDREAALDRYIASGGSRAAFKNRLDFLIGVQTRLQAKMHSGSAVLVSARPTPSATLAGSQDCSSFSTALAIDTTLCFFGNNSACQSAKFDAAALAICEAVGVLT